MSKMIEVFTDGQVMGEEMIEKVKEYACSRCAVTVYDASKEDQRQIMKERTEACGVRSLPAIAIDGKLLDLQVLNRGRFGKLFHHVFGK